MIRTISLFLLLLVSVRSFAATHTWLGTVSDKVSEAANWSGGSPVGDPAAVLVFPAETARRAVTNDVSGLKFLAIEFAAGGYTVSGSPLATTDGRITSPAPGSTVACDLAVTGQLEITGVTLSGAVSGTGGLFVNGGYVTFSGAKANTYSGATVVHAASLTLQKPADVVAVPGDLTSSSSLIFAEAAGLIADAAHLAGSGEDNWLNLRGDQTVRSIKGFGVAPLGGKQPRLTVTKLGGGGDLLVNVTLKEGPVDVPAGMTLKVKDLQVPVSGLTITGGGSVQFFTSAIVPLQIDGPSANVTAPYTTVTLLHGAFHGTAGSLIATGGTVTYAASAGDLRFGPAVTVALEGGKFSLNGTLDLGGATVQWPTTWADVAMPPAIAISNQSAAPPIGTFAGVVEGVKTASGFVVNYHGGDGNDVTIVRPRADDAKQRAAVAFTYEPSPVHAGKPVSLRATFSGPGAVPTGTVTFANAGYLDTEILDEVQLVAGTATIVHTIPVDATSEMIQIWYSGDAAHHPSEHEFGVAVHNAVPSIASIAPATGVAGTFVDVTIHGSQFEPGSTVSLAEKNGIATQFVSPAELRVKLDLSRYQFATTVWLRVAAPDGDASNEVQFAITMPPRDPNVMLDFDEHGASALVTRGANSVWLTGLNGLRSIRDDDEDGVVLWPWSYPYAEMWAVVDVASGRWDVRGSYGGAAPPAEFAPHTFIRDAAGVVSQFVLRVPGQAPFGRSRWYLLWVRPGVGAWMNVITDGDDADRSINGILFGSTRQMLPYGPAVKTPDGFATGDVLIAMRSDNAVIGTTMAATLDDELIDGASGVLQFVSTFDNSMTAVEGKSDSATALVIRTDGGEGTVTVNYATAPVSAYGQQSYVHTTGTLTFAPGETVKAIAVPLVNDDMYVEGVFDIVLSNPSGATLGTGTTMRVYVQDNDPRPTVAAAGPNPRVVRETDSPQTIDVQLVIAATRFGSVSVPWTLRKYPSSEIEASGTAYFGEGQQVAMISFPLPGDIENNRDWDYELSWKGPYDSSGTLRIVLQDDDAPVVTAPNVAVLEAQQSARVRLSIQKPLSHPLRVDYATANATATSPGDYTSTTGSVVFAAGEMHQEFAVPIANDQKQEDDETFSVELAWIADVPKRLSVSVSVLDDDGPQTPRATIAATTTVESSGAATFEVRLSAASADAVTIFYSTADGTATAGGDYQQATEGELRFAPGELVKTIVVPIITDDLDEADETFVVKLERGTNAGIGTEREATATIVDDDSAAVKPPSRRRSVRH